MTERRFPLTVWLFALLVAALTSLPYALGALSAPDGWAYSGAAAVPAGAQVDYNSHMAKLWQGSRGDWAYQLLFTHEDHPGIVGVQGFYVALGAVGGILPLSHPLLYHLARFALTIGVVLAMWAWARRFFQRPGERWLALCFGIIVSGWSWLLYFIAPEMAADVAPIELWLMDAYNLAGAFYMPHFAAAIILQTAALLIFDAWVKQDGARSEVQIAWLTLILAVDAIIQPYVVLMTFPLFGLLALYHIFISKQLTFQRALWLIIPAGAHGGVVIYQYLAISGDPIWASFSEQNQTHSPPPIYYLLGYLAFWIPLLFGWRSIRAALRDDHAWVIPLLWLLIVALLVYAPFPTQRRYLLGVQTPLAILAAVGWSRGILRALPGRVRPLLTLLYIGLASIAPLLLIYGNITALTQPRSNPDLFYSADEIAGYDWLMENSTPDDLILTTFNWAGRGSGGRLVAATGRRAFMGHWIETADFDTKIAQMTQFYNPTTDDAWRREFLDEIGAVYIWYDDYARAFGDWDITSADYLDAVFESDGVTIFAAAP